MPDNRFVPAHEPGSPAGMSASDVERRNAIGQWFGKEIWPATGSEVRSKAAELGAPDDVLAELQNLSEGPYENTQAVMRELGIPVEQRRQ